MPKRESNNGEGRKGRASLPELIDIRTVKALDHVLRQHILLATVLGEVSPKELAEALDEQLSQVSYHVKVLRDDCDGMIEETRTVQRRGALEHFYRASAKTLFPAKAWRRLKTGLRAVVGAGQANDLFNDLAAALKAGKLRGEHDHIVRTPLLLDAEGARRVKDIAERATSEIEAEQQATAKRLAKANGDRGKTTGHVFALLSFEAAWDASDLAISADQAGDGAAIPARDANGTHRNGGESKRGGRRAGTARQ